MGKSETLLQVKDAESKAKQTIEQARTKEKEILSSARKEAVEKIQQAEKDLRSKSASELASQKASLASQKEGLLQKGNDDAAALESAGSKEGRIVSCQAQPIVLIQLMKKKTAV